MKPIEPRRLLGGYATGSLTEAERTALFQAALEDQELFDELAGEQALKEVLDEPGARQRLILALEAPPRHRAWLWAGAVATAAIAVVIGIAVSPRTAPPPQQIAQVMKSPEPVASPEPPVPAVAAPRPAPAPVQRKVAPSPPAPAAVPELQKAEAENKRADQLQPAQPQAPEALRGLVAGTAPAVGRFRAENATAAARVAFFFNYSVGSDGFLQIVPMAAGYLSVSARGTVLFPSDEVSPGTPVRIAIPSGATSLLIAFSTTPGITGAPVPRDGASGTVTDQDPPNGRILIQLFLKPATQ